MDKSDLILAAIEQLGRSLEAKIEAKIDSKVDSLRAELKADIASLANEVRAETRVLSARLDEQRQTLNALIPQRIAAVGRSTDAAE